MEEYGKGSRIGPPSFRFSCVRKRKRPNSELAKEIFFSLSFALPPRSYRPPVCKRFGLLPLVLSLSFFFLSPNSTRNMEDLKALIAKVATDFIRYSLGEKEESTLEIDGKTRSIQVRIRGRFHSLREWWVYDAKARDVETGMEAQVRHFKSNSGAKEHAVAELLSQLRELGHISTIAS